MPSFLHEDAVHAAWALCCAAFCYLILRSLGTLTRWAGDRLCPELQTLTPDQREKVWDGVNGKDWWWRGFCLTLALGVLYYWLPHLLIRLGIRDRHVVSSLRFPIVLGLAAFLFPLLYAIQRHELRRLIRREMNCIGVPTCMACGQCLVGTAVDICSFCGEPHRKRCYRCDGMGRISRREVLIAGLALLIGWAVLMLQAVLTFPFAANPPPRAWMYIYVRFLMVFPGLIVLGVYIQGGRTKQCHACGGTGLPRLCEDAQPLSMPSSPPEDREPTHPPPTAS